MAFRTLEISNPAELHVNKAQLEITQGEDFFSIPLEDIVHIICYGQDIRVSTMTMSKLLETNVILAFRYVKKIWTWEHQPLQLQILFICLQK
jgi:CRISPR/Cas system-associated endonuclease Cas1